MNDQSAVRVIALLTAAWPDTELPDATLTLWMDSMRDIDPALGMEAAATLTRTNKWYPRLAEFLDAVNALKRRQIVQDSEVRALPPVPRADRRLAKARLLALREAMSDIGTGAREQTHSHSLAGCPGCEAMDARVSEIHAGLS